MSIQKSPQNLDESRKSWNKLFANRIASKIGWPINVALQVADAANDSFKKKLAPGEAADREMAKWQ